MKAILIGAMLPAIMLSSLAVYEFEQHRVAVELGNAFGCGRFYAGNFDPADDPRDDHSKCYPYYKAWEKSEQWPATK